MIAVFAMVCLILKLVEDFSKETRGGGLDFSACTLNLETKGVSLAAESYQNH
jgi:hypothetical protein